MAYSPSTSEQRARLIREMSRDLSRTRSHTPRPSSAASSHASRPEFETVSSFDPENEALMSTRQLDSVTKNLPRMRSSAQKYGRYNPPQPVDRISTSTLGRAFPDFSSANMTDNDNSLSIEVGRGLKHTPSKLGQSEMESNAEISLGEDSHYEITATPPTRPNPISRKTGQAEVSLRKQVQLRRASLPQKEAQEIVQSAGPAAENAKKSNQSRPRTLADMHARVASDNDNSQANEERPPTINTASKSTRFGNGKARQTSKGPKELPDKFTSANGLLQTLGKNIGNATSTQQTQPTVTQQSTTTTGNGTATVTAQSFMLPNLPNITELVSGTYHDGTPVFSRHTQPRSRFMSGSHARRPAAPKTAHAKIESIPVPTDEKAIFASLQLLKDKVAYLEADKAEWEQKVDEYENEIAQLRSDLRSQQTRKRSDSALGTTDEEDGEARPDWKVEKTRLESSVKSLQDRLDRANCKISVSEVSVKRLTQERDNIVAQLGVAFYSSEELKAENDVLRKENEELKLQLAQLSNERRLETEHWNDKETELRGKIERREETVREMQDLTREIFTTRATRREATTSIKEKRKSQSREPQSRKMSAAQPERNTQMKISDHVQQELQKLRLNQQSVDGQLQHRRTSPKKSKLEQRPDTGRRPPMLKSASHEAEFYDATDLQSTTDIERPSCALFKDVDTTRVEADTAGSAAPTATVNETLLTLMEEGAISKLRKVLEDERALLKEKKKMELETQQRQNQADDAMNVTEARTLPRKPSMKDVTRHPTVQFADDEATGRFSLPTRLDDSQMSEQEHDNDKEEATAKARNNVDESALSNSSRKRRSMPEMTSAFILPDITMNFINRVETASSIVLNPAQHESKNCTVCHDALPASSETNKTAPAIPNPVPVSERMPAATPGNEDPTIRPSQPPSLALATVLKQFEDEISHLRLELARQETLYNAHDPSLSKRRRKEVYGRIGKLLAVLERKSDMVYALYDVLEGQKGMGKEEVEETLRSLGVGVAQETGTGKGMNKGRSKDNDADMGGVESGTENENEDGNDAEVPFDGFEDSLGSLGVDG